MAVEKCVENKYMLCSKTVRTKTATPYSMMIRAAKAKADVNMSTPTKKDYAGTGI